MIKLLYKTTFLTLLLTSIALFTKAQIGYDYAQYDLGFGGETNLVYGDAETVKLTPSAHVNFTYNATPYVNYVFEIQAGVLEGGSINSTSGRYFKNNFTALVFRGQVQAGELIDYSRSAVMNAVKNFYVSSGFGYVINDVRNINRNSLVLPDFYTGGLDRSNELYIPARLGYEFKVFNKYNQPSFKVDLGIQYNYVFGDNLDGFDAGAAKDNFVQYSIGFKFALGGVTSYRKQIDY
ncbi:hypothetical protein A0256_23510 [Mucilaginibacter sp. PAMC 26640]|nr:hypothetical protein A0256_23510 [Mucilaginibacter sp. PAMC 26640]